MCWLWTASTGYCNGKKMGEVIAKLFFFTPFIQVEWIWISTSVKMEWSLLSKAMIEKVQYWQKTNELPGGSLKLDSNTANNSCDQMKRKEEWRRENEDQLGDG